MRDKKKFALNFAAQIAVLGSQFIISFVLTPIVLQKLGDEAYGFVGLVNNFVSYVAIITAALNAMASRFITVSYHGGRTDDAKEYFSSVFFSNCVMAIAILVGSVFLAANIDTLVSVAPELVTDLRITVLLAFFERWDKPANRRVWGGRLHKERALSQFCRAALWFSSACRLPVRALLGCLAAYVVF